MLRRVVLVLVAFQAGTAQADALADLGGATCADSKAVHLETQCSCTDKRDLPQSATVRYVEKADTVGGAGFVPKALPSRCDLPVYIQCQFEIDPVSYAANHPFTSHGAQYQFVHRTGHLFGTHHMMGSSMSPFMANGSRVDPKNPASVPRNFYVQEYTVDSEAAFKWWEWYLGNYFAVGPSTVNPAVLNEHGRVVFSGMCEEFATRLYALENIGAFGNIVEVPFMLGDSYARPVTPLDPTKPPMTFTTRESMTDKPADWILGDAYPRVATAPRGGHRAPPVP